MPETDQLLPSTNGYYNIPKNKDGSIDLWFGPNKPEGVADSAFIKTFLAVISSWHYDFMVPKTVSMTRPGCRTIWFRPINNSET
ncbi:Uncharacterised protein [Salmonella enterica subsp. enterica]|nr:Uncharacterised protein [Salmonella enterica subsp. enterica]